MCSLLLGFQGSSSVAAAWQHTAGSARLALTTQTLAPQSGLWVDQGLLGLTEAPQWLIGLAGLPLGPPLDWLLLGGSWHRAQSSAKSPTWAACVVCVYATQGSIFTPRQAWKVPPQLFTRFPQCRAICQNYLSHIGPTGPSCACNHAFRLFDCAWSGTMHAVGPAWCSAAVAAAGAGCFCPMAQESCSTSSACNAHRPWGSKLGLPAAGVWWGWGCGGV